MNLRLLPAALLFCALSACTPLQHPEEAAIFGVIRQNLAAMQGEDIEAVMATIHGESPDVAATRALIEEIFAKYDLRYDVQKLKIVSTADAEVKVSFVQKTARTGGADDLPNNTVEGIHTLKKQGGQWKLSRTMTLRMKQEEPR